jgi:FkbM family methyltransferase
MVALLASLMEIQPMMSTAFEPLPGQSRWRELVLAVQPFAQAPRRVARRALLWHWLQTHAEAIRFQRAGQRWTGSLASADLAARFIHEEQDECSAPSPVLERSLLRLGQLLHLLLPIRSPLRTHALRSLLWRLLQGQAELLSFQRQGMHWCGPITSSITASLFINGQYQHESLPALLRWLAENTDWHARRTIVNVGANIGDSAIALAKQTDKRILACEPVPDVFQLLRENVRANHLEQRIDACQLAIATEDGWAEMLVPHDPGYSEVRNTGGGQGFPHPLAECGRFRVWTQPLANLLRDQTIPCGDVGLVWSDTQGCESEVIASGAGLWRAGVPLWVEVWPRGLQAHGGVERFLSLARTHFRRFIPQRCFAKPGRIQPREIADLEALVRTLAGPDFTDVLLIP